MRLLYWSELFYPYIGGIEILNTKLLPALRERGYEVIIVTSHDYLHLPDEADYEGIPVYRFPFRTALTKGNIDLLVAARQRLARIKRAFAPDLVHVNGVGPSVLFHLQTRDIHPAPVLVTMHTEVLPTEAALHGTLLGRTLQSANWVTGVSNAVLAQTRELVPEITPRSSLIYNCVNTPLLAPTQLPLDPPRLVCLGRLAPFKGFDLALTALPSLVDRFPRVQMVVAGDGPSRPELERQAVELGIDERVHFIGWVAPDHVPTLLNTATVVVMPSRREGLPLVALEAALMARPVVATCVGGLPEVVVHEQTGVLVEPDDSQALAEAVAALLADPERTTRMGREARRRAQEVFNLERCVDAYTALYRKLIQENRPVGFSQKAFAAIEAEVPRA